MLYFQSYNRDKQTGAHTDSQGKSPTRNYTETPRLLRTGAPSLSESFFFFQVDTTKRPDHELCPKHDHACSGQAGPRAIGRKSENGHGPPVLQRSSTHAPQKSFRVAHGRISGKLLSSAFESCSSWMILSGTGQGHAAQATGCVGLSFCVWLYRYGIIRNSKQVELRDHCVLL